MNKLFYAIILFMLFTPVNVSSKDDFPWELFVPLITHQSKCSKVNLDLCNDQITCEKVGGYWWSKACNKSMSTSQIFMARLAGNVHFTYYILGYMWYDDYYFDINTLRETDSQEGFFEIYGIDEYGNQVRVYDYPYDHYIFVNYGFPEFDERFIFKWLDPPVLSSSPDLTGTYFIKDKNQPSWEDSLVTIVNGYRAN